MPAIILLITGLLLSTIARAESNDCIIDRYLRAMEQTMQADANSKHVEEVLAFYSSDISYEHPRVGAKIEGVDNLRKGMLGFLGKSRDGKINVLSHTKTLNVVVVEYERQFAMETDTGWTNRVQKQLTLFEFEGEQISRVLDYW